MGGAPHEENPEQPEGSGCGGDGERPERERPRTANDPKRSGYGGDRGRPERERLRRPALRSPPSVWPQGYGDPP
ncbi:hypothetical protein GCM10010140_17030 [Streptosporangium pseudovulgare]|uniref:Uncharacterized protein n=1 Tax=Streptosporangium pseudovulgare TaxID=35765 RepID=A0ABQ2QQJ1_9ACTN|nr:hypothetical protein GCM10010140_17030 [Streptosporangium pseudovulgare]